MSDPRDVLNSRFSTANRFANFGNVLEKIQVSGFRVHKNTILDIRNPITAICGLNGTGKSTILQAAAVAYKNLGIGHYYFKHFFVVSGLDPSPYTDKAEVICTYCEKDGKTGKVTVARNAGATRKGWTGYKRRRERHVFYGGVGMFIPKVEKRDFLVNGAKKLVVDSHADVRDEVKKWVSQIIGRAYESIHEVQAHSGAKKGRVLRFCRNTVQYSETHMGFGEGRVACLVERLETIPDKSLVLLEEPETSLHPSAQHQLGAYFMDVCLRRGHQIILTTHSEYLLRALPSTSRVYFHLSDGDIRQVTGLTASHATSLMTEGHDKSLSVLVEDGCANALLIEILRRVDPVWLQTIQIHEGGDCDSIKTTMRVLKDSGIAVAAVLDGDQTPSPGNGIFTLPGGLPPEKVILGLPEVRQHLQATYHMDWTDFEVREKLSSINHHEWIPRLAKCVLMDELSLTRELARVAASVLPENNLTAMLKESTKQ
jgi:predicted ATPase